MACRDAALTDEEAQALGQLEVERTLVAGEVAHESGHSMALMVRLMQATLSRLAIDEKANRGHWIHDAPLPDSHPAPRRPRSDRPAPGRSARPARAAALVGLFLYGVSLALMVRGALGLAPWDVLHSGFIRHVPITLGQAVVLFSFVVAACSGSRCGRSRGIGTIANAFIVGLSADATLAVLAAAGRVGRVGSR